ncbi:hypothetical protein FO519_000149 [Halicephalobus sp. NKZ332]|nr:hypothetical protein FO519_000149 [Halicephalobus sp. NKZ332]
MTTRCKCFNLAFKLQKAVESDQIESFFRRAIQCITEEDYNKIIRFRFKDDSLSCLVGRLFLRQMAKKITGKPWYQIEFKTTDRGKPYMVDTGNLTFGMNISHHGNYTVFSSSCSENVGVDVMKLEESRSHQSVDEYINFMAKSFSSEELRIMRSQETDFKKMTMFYRFWCLKESILKSTGIGIVKDLRNYDFRIDPAEPYEPGCFLTSTKLILKGVPSPQWVFEESFLDENHVIAVCREKDVPETCSRRSSNPRITFTEVGFDFLLDGASVLNPLLEDGSGDFENFQEKSMKNF